MNKRKEDHFGLSSYGNWKDDFNPISEKNIPMGHHRLDSSIYEDVCEALFNHPEIDTSDFEVNVREGTVYLDGFIQTGTAKKVTEIVIEKIPGVLEIQNHLRFHKNGTNEDNEELGGLKMSKNKNPLIRNETGLI